MTVERRRRLAATRETSFPELKSYFKVSECWVHLKVPGQIAEVSQINIKWYPLNDSAQFASFSIMGKSINDVCNISGSLDSLQQDRFISAVCWGFRQVCLLMLANTAIWCPFCPHWVHGNTSYHSCEPFLLAQILRSIFMQPSLPLAPPPLQTFFMDSPWRSVHFTALLSPCHCLVRLSPLPFANCDSECRARAISHCPSIHFHPWQE